MCILRVAGDEVLLASSTKPSVFCFMQQMQGKWIESRVILAFVDGKIHDKHLDINDLSIFQ